jgi:hypothetical protein
MTPAKLQELAREAAQCVSCSDHDEDCEGIEDKVHCWLYDPARGMCPYLRALAQQADGEAGVSSSAWNGLPPSS